ncbi:FadR/GntR family transcriptional regulator [Corynebacterium sp. CNJ-954]|uniref:FadR/GntR family transcriptional regulator n=1 Tax=Corynebacterium sp. CNJ-954 TaxID=1904962 RepID=UPI00096A92B1|nr:FadR/GntR family transcriptional regulator [Corynebacterium sp. CNJ-954]
MEENTVKTLRSPLVTQVIDIMRKKVSSGAWPVGARIPLEAELQRDYGVSRVTLRQAVQALVHVGILVTVQGSGTYVRSTSELEAVFQRFLAEEDLTSLLEARLAIEPQAAELAALRATEDDLWRMGQILSSSRTAAKSGNLSELTPLSSQFHREMVHAAHNRLLDGIYKAMEPVTEHTVREGSGHEPLTSFVDEHEDILHAIRKGDGHRAFTAARNHLHGVIDVQ